MASEKLTLLFLRYHFLDVYSTRYIGNIPNDKKMVVPFKKQKRKGELAIIFCRTTNCDAFPVSFYLDRFFCKNPFENYSENIFKIRRRKVRYYLLRNTSKLLWHALFLVRWMALSYISVNFSLQCLRLV